MSTLKHSFSRFAYFDTNIISHLAKNRQLWSKLSDFLMQNDLTLGISSAHAAELSDAKKLHQILSDLFISVPSAVLKTSDMILAKEVKAHPSKRQDSLLLYPLNTILIEPNGLHKLQEFFSSKKLYNARKDQLLHAQQMARRHNELKNNFPPSKSGKYTREQADEFAEIQVMQWLAALHKEFLASFQKNIESFHPEIFLSVRLFAHVIFYKYYLGSREPRGTSDFGDLMHLFCIPYCELAIIERDLCNILNQIKRNHDTLELTIIQNIDFFDNWDYR